MKKKSSLLTIIILCLCAIILAGLFLTAMSIGNRDMVGIIIGIIVLILGIIASCHFTHVYNKLVRYKNKVSESLALIDIQLKLRFDLIPNLVNTVKGYTKHEEKVFEEVVKLRNQAIKMQDEQEKLEAANKLLPKLKHILVLAEDYPKLKADSLFKSLMEELSVVEDKIVASRRIYDSNVNSYNTLIQTFPNNIYAYLFGFEKQELFKIDAGEHLATNISFGGKK